MDDPKMYDITFVVGEGLVQTSFRAHRRIVSSSSPVLRQLCLGVPFKGKVELPNVDPDDFHSLLGHMYGEETAIQSIQHAWNLLPTAKKYGLSKLQQLCRWYILNSIDAHNACAVYEEAIEQEEGSLLLESFRFIVTNARHILRENGLIGAFPSTVAAVARQECIDIESEYELFTAILEWAKTECAVRKCPKTPENLRKAVYRLLPYVRFLTMRTFEFVKGPASSGILTNDEIVGILFNMFSPGSSKLPAWCNSSVESRRPNSGFNETSWDNSCFCLGSEEESCKHSTTLFKNKDKALLIVGIGFRLTLTHLPIVRWFSAIISVKTEERTDEARFEIRELPVVGEQIARFDNPVFIKGDEIFRVVIDVDQLSPYVHCCELKSCEGEPFAVLSEDGDEYGTRLTRGPVATCFSTIRYLSIT